MDQVLFSSQDAFGQENQTQFRENIDAHNGSTNYPYNQSVTNSQTHHRSWPNWWATLEFLNKYYIPTIVTVGIIGNSISCVVFLCTHLRIRSSSYYLAALAIADVGFLLTLFLVWLASVGVEAFNLEGWCQIAVYLSSTSSFLSVWFIIAFTVERFIAIQYPLQRPQMCTVRRAKLTVLSLSAFAFLIHSYLLCMAGLVRSDASNKGKKSASYMCGLLPKYYDAMSVINSVDTVITLILPLLLIIVMNSLIARQLCIFSNKHRHQEMTSQFQSGCSRPSRASFHSQSQPGSSETRSHNNNNSQNSNVVVVLKGSDLNAGTSKPSHRSILSQRTQYTITKMLLLISTVFIILNLPSYVFRIYLFVGDSETSIIRSEFAFIIQQISMLLYYSNFSVNFILYSMYGMTFRRALMQLIRSHLHVTGIWRTKSDSLQFK